MPFGLVIICDTCTVVNMCVCVGVYLNTIHLQSVNAGRVGKFYTVCINVLQLGMQDILIVKCEFEREEQKLSVICKREIVSFVTVAVASRDYII